MNLEAIVPSIEKSAMILKNILVYYLFIFTPALALALAVKYHLISSNFFLFALLFYCLVYHPFISGIRLLALGKVTGRRFWLNFIPGWNTKYFGTLFLGK
jgi:hypothetical protein